ncbi:paratose synthase [Yersinia enterocolitica]|uniref:Paratose synthase n=2 Tax=Yersinia enterocolitica TaxID=630 RepID=A1JN98_YERE8|nr:NAD(P)-dependent oxidoreductase [Yersinia enterocolitica]AAC60764.1 WbcB [Yersinia enterocolitica (type O:8)]AJI82144.1 3-beta hydroxysteroid dehydrogenase/isomerase family protein [Yersinia enterocolitica]AJJ23047.1 3-beta hydroxysteroid dehydrogenase/isomerase family protein [Yersinia enterocolitica]EKA28743.1 paratose synthase [Yersinia enterocolitica subsp. enterocolitica WA-314]ELI8283718.1 NAD(P)-dependent oxidoreductase [Yersinia enterocolitica]
MRILITGASGYIGSNLACYLNSNGFEVFGLIRSEVVDENKIKLLSGVKLEILDEKNLCSLVENINPDIVIHIASLTSVTHDYSTIENLLRSNIEFPTKLLEAMEVAGVKKFINTGTTWQNYNSADYEPVNLYAATKQAFEDILKYYIFAKGFSSITLRLFDTYGPNDTRKKLIPLLDRLAETKESLDMSEGNQEIELVHINDICSAYKTAILKLQDGQPGYANVYSVDTGSRMSLKKLVKLYEKVNDVTLNINWGARPPREREIMRLCTNLTVLPNWSPTIPLDEGINKKNR